MALIANVALTDTFDIWRTRTNQLAIQSNAYEGNILDLYNRGNNSPSYAFANNIGVQANAFASATIAGANALTSSTIAGANAAVGLGANSYANVVWARANVRMDLGGVYANAFASATIAGANSAVGAGANAYALSINSVSGTGFISTIDGANTAVGGGANAFSRATIAGANAAVGLGANSYANVVWARANARMDVVGSQANSFSTTAVTNEAALARNAVNLTSGIVPSARMSGSYTSITGVGTLTAGTWNASIIPVTHGGTGGNDQATARNGLGLVIGTNVQAYSARLGEIAALAPTADNFIVGNGTAWTLETPTNARSSLGLGTIATQASSGVAITGGTISGLTSLATTGGTVSTMAYQGSGAVAITGGTISGLTSLATTGGTVSTMAYQGSGAVSISGGSISGLSSLGVSGTITTAAGIDITTQGSAVERQLKWVMTGRSVYLYGQDDSKTLGLYDSAVGHRWVTDSSGNFSVYADITAFISDERLKTDIRPIDDALDKISKIRGIYYRHNDLALSKGFEDKDYVGVIAQEVKEVLPEVVVTAPFDKDENGNSISGENYMTVKYDKIVPLLIEAIKELTAKVELLESKVEK
jgi:hypothetical protein